MMVSHRLCAPGRSPSYLVLSGHRCELGKLDGASSLPTLQEWFHNSLMEPQYLDLTFMLCLTVFCCKTSYSYSWHLYNLALGN